MSPPKKDEADHHPSASDQKPKYLPADTCVFCDKRLEDVGGQRLCAQRHLGCFLSEQLRGGGNPETPDRHFKVSDEPLTYLILRGAPSTWTDERIEKAKTQFSRGRHPWFCQVCGNRTCRECGTPLRRPIASDVLYTDGSTSHVGILGVDVGCSNVDCSRYRRRD